MRHLLIVFFLLAFLSVAWGEEAEVTATSVGEKVSLPDGTTFQYFNLEDTVKRGYLTVPERVGLHCKGEVCSVVLPSKDVVAFSIQRAVVTAILIATAVRLVIHFVASGSSGSSTSATVGGGGGGGPPPGPPGGPI